MQAWTLLDLLPVYLLAPAAAVTAIAAAVAVRIAAVIPAGVAVAVPIAITVARVATIGAATTTRTTTTTGVAAVAVPIAIAVAGTAVPIVGTTVAVAVAAAAVALVVVAFPGLSREGRVSPIERQGDEHVSRIRATLQRRADSRQTQRDYATGDYLSNLYHPMIHNYLRALLELPSMAIAHRIPVYPQQARPTQPRCQDILNK